jgi:molecular chaperone GrpE (heat shock protein)
MTEEETMSSSKSQRKKRRTFEPLVIILAALYLLVVMGVLFGLSPNIIALLTLIIVIVSGWFVMGAKKKKPEDRQEATLKKSATNNQLNLQEVTANSDNKLDSMAEFFQELRDDIKKTGLQCSKNQFAVEDNTVVAKELKEKFIAVDKAIGELLIDQRQNNAKLGRELEDWQKAALEYLEAMERSIIMLRDCSNPTDKQIHDRQMAEKAVLTFFKLFQPLGLEKIEPSPGDPLDDRLHEGYQEVETKTIPEGHIVASEGWGYRIGTQIRKRARVTVAKAVES